MLRISRYRATLEYDREGALRALRSASVRLEGVSSDLFTGLRDQIAADLEALEAASTPDIASLMEALSRLVVQVGRLASKDPDITPDAQSTTEEGAAEPGWRALLSAMSKNLQQFVIIERADGADRPSLIPEQDRLARRRPAVSAVR